MTTVSAQVCIACIVYIVYNLFEFFECRVLALLQYLSGFALLQYLVRSRLFYFFFWPKIIIINPRRACAERVTVVVSCVCVSVCMYVCPNTLFWQYAQLEV